MNMDKQNWHIIYSAEELTQNNNALEGVLWLETDAEVQGLLSCLSEQGSTYDFNIKGEADLGKSVRFTFAPYSSLAHASYEDVLSNYGLKDELADKLKNCIFHQWAKQHHSKQVIDEKCIDALVSLLTLLKQQGYPHSNSLIFFSQHPVFICLSLSAGDATLLCERLRDLNSAQVESIHSLCEFFGTGEETQHTEEKKRVFSVVLNSLLENKQNCKIIDILGCLEKLAQEVKGQYSLYLENFSYEKFVKKLEENNEKFVSRINDTLSKILSQILALPIAATALNFFNKEHSYIGFIGLACYSILCFIALINQVSILYSLKDELNSFGSPGKIPKALEAQWDKNKTYLDKLFKYQNYLWMAMYLTILLCMVYVAYHLTEIFFKAL